MEIYLCIYMDFICVSIIYLSYFFLLSFLCKQTMKKTNENKGTPRTVNKITIQHKTMEYTTKYTKYIKYTIYIYLHDSIVK